MTNHFQLKQVKLFVIVFVFKALNQQLALPLANFQKPVLVKSQHWWLALFPFVLNFFPLILYFRLTIEIVWLRIFIENLE